MCRTEEVYNYMHCVYVYVYNGFVGVGMYFGERLYLWWVVYSLSELLSSFGPLYS